MRNIAIAISADVYNRINGVGEVGGIVGAAVSGSFLFIVGLANTVILWRIIRRRKQQKILEKRRQNGEEVEDINHNPKHDHMLMMRILGPIITFVNRPWKMYPVGVLFGFGFDTASSIALIAVSALAKKRSDGSSIPSGQIIILPLLFTAGMTLVDSVDSILMLYSYTGFPERTLLIFAPTSKENSTEATLQSEKTDAIKEKSAEIVQQAEEKTSTDNNSRPSVELETDSTVERDTRVKMNVMSGLSIILTLMSILVAFSISLITIMSLIGEQCGACVSAAEADDGHGGGLAGRWWRGWAQASEQSGYIGIAIVGAFLVIVVGWYSTRWVARKFKSEALPPSLHA
uniref:Nickel/cobalt efflux system n=1 Tax=Psilocybe cubensis TaxID=181762 RepID=A0A8H8CHJ5_PSICU